MNLSDLISEYGDDKVMLQKLDDASESMTFHRKSGTRITFVTSVRLDSQGTEKMGLVLWMDRDRVAEIIKDKTDSR